jgi:secreted trypsin-like serine protease
LEFLGPLTTVANGKTTVVGVTSFADAKCSTASPSVFARVTTVKDWILSNTDAGDYQCSTGTKGENNLHFV